jgi:hypothetical protein
VVILANILDREQCSFLPSAPVGRRVPDTVMIPANILDRDSGMQVASMLWLDSTVTS